MAVMKRDNKWYITYYFKEDGKRKFRMEVAGPRKDMAEAKLKEYKELIRQGIDPRRKKKASGGETPSDAAIPPTSVSREMLTLEQFIPIFLELHGKNQSAKMQESYQSSFGHLKPVFGKSKLNSITKLMVKTYMANRKLDEVSNATVNKEVSCLKGVLSRAAEWGYIEVNNLLGLKLLKEAPIRERYLTREESRHLIDAAPTFLRDIIVFALGTGMRQDEIFGLKWENVILNQRFRHGEITIVGKGGKRRNIRMNQTVYELLARKRRESKNCFVFPSPKTGVKIINIDRSFHEALKKAGISNFHFHDLRHTAASWMVQAGVPIYAVKEILGHSQVATTQRYAHQSPEYLESQLGVLDEFLCPRNDDAEEPPMGVAV